MPDARGPEELQRAASELAAALKELREYGVRATRLAACGSLEELLDASDRLLLDAVDFVFYRVYLTDESGAMELVREAAPEGVAIDWELVRWAVRGRGVSLLPASGIEDAGVRSLLVVPLLGRERELGAALLWVEFDEASFTEHTADLLRAYGRAASSALENLRLTEELRGTQAFLQHVLEGVPLGIFALDGDGRVSMINGTAEFMTRTRREEVLGRTPAKVFSPELADAARTLASRLARGEDPGEEELALSFAGEEAQAAESEDEEAKHVITLGLTASLLAPQVGAAAGDAGIVFVCRDLEMSREIAKLRELDRMKDDLLSLVSHELRTPLASMMAYAEALGMEGMVETEEERTEYLQVIMNEGERLGRLINDVLDLTKLQAGKIQYHFEEGDVNETAAAAADVALPAAAKKDLALERELADALPAIRYDSDRVTQVLMNLFSNATKFTPEGGTITLRTRVRSATAEEGGRGERVEVSVADTGCGIPASEVHRVWSPFEQVESTRHHTRGTGLGMPICRQIVEEGHAGRIWLESEPDAGTTVYFSLPV